MWLYPNRLISLFLDLWRGSVISPDEQQTGYIAGASRGVFFCTCMVGTKGYWQLWVTVCLIYPAERCGHFDWNKQRVLKSSFQNLLCYFTSAELWHASLPGFGWAGMGLTRGWGGIHLAQDLHNIPWCWDWTRCEIVHDTSQFRELKLHSPNRYIFQMMQYCSVLAVSILAFLDLE